MLMDQLIAVGQDYSDWAEDQFLAELPDKFSLSFAIQANEEVGHGPDCSKPRTTIQNAGTLNDGIVGYCIMSRKWPDKVHIHHFMIHHERRSLGLGPIMLDEAGKRAADLPLSLKVPNFNVGAIKFYERHGFTIDREVRQISWMLKNK